MRKLGIFLIVMMVVALFMVPTAMAASNQLDRIEEDHDDYGMTSWLAPFDKKIWAGVQIGGDGAYGFYTGLNPGFNGIGVGLIFEDDTNHVLGAPSYTNPCPVFVDADSNSTTLLDGDFIPGGCVANVDTDEPQTAPLDTEWEIPILDDMLAKMWDYEAANHFLTQQLDILFYLDPKGTQKGFIDQTLDQDLADWTGAGSSYMSDGDGIKQRLVSIFQLLGDASKSFNGQIINGNEYIDQWLMSYVKDVDAGVGIVSSISSWFELDKDPFSCPDCTYTYSTGHDPVVKVVPEIDNHP